MAIVDSNPQLAGQPLITRFSGHTLRNTVSTHLCFPHRIKGSMGHLSALPEPGIRQRPERNMLCAVAMDTYPCLAGRAFPPGPLPFQIQDGLFSAVRAD